MSDKDKVAPEPEVKTAAAEDITDDAAAEAAFAEASQASAKRIHQTIEPGDVEPEKSKGADKGKPGSDEAKPTDKGGAKTSAEKPKAEDKPTAADLAKQAAAEQAESDRRVANEAEVERIRTERETKEKAEAKAREDAAKQAVAKPGAALSADDAIAYLDTELKDAQFGEMKGLAGFRELYGEDLLRAFVGIATALGKKTAPAAAPADTSRDQEVSALLQEARQAKIQQAAAQWRGAFEKATGIKADYVQELQEDTGFWDFVDKNLGPDVAKAVERGVNKVVELAIRAYDESRGKEPGTARKGSGTDDAAARRKAEEDMGRATTRAKRGDAGLRASAENEIETDEDAEKLFEEEAKKRAAGASR